MIDRSLIQINVRHGLRNEIKAHAKRCNQSMQDLFNYALLELVDGRTNNQVIFRALPQKGELLNVPLSFSMARIVDAIAEEENVSRRSVVFTALSEFLENGKAPSKGRKSHSSRIELYGCGIPCLQ